MCRGTLGLLVAALVGSPAWGGTVVFSPSGQAWPIPGRVIQMTLTLQATGAVTDISAADVLIGSDAPFTFAYSDEWLAAMSNVTVPTSVGFYVEDLLVGGSHSAFGVGRSIELGTVTVDTIGLSIGTYDIFVYSDADGISGIYRGLPGQEFVSEPLSGRGGFYPVPEPGAFVLLGVGALAVVRRRVT